MRRRMILAATVMMSVFILFACGSGVTEVKSYAAVDFGKLKGMPGFSDQLLEMHFALYKGYVKNTNLLAEQLAKMAAQGQSGTPAFAELKRRFGWEWNGMRLHELYFGNLGGKEPLQKESKLRQKLAENFGSYEAWAADFQATGAMRGIGWVVLYEDPKSGRLLNVWINEHDVGHLAGGNPLLVMDVFEHAYLPDYGLKRGDYIRAFMDNVDWAAVEKRLSK
ncbi:MAG: Fe-Mn family superoxide dismutase [Syntrophales bacterium]|nr:Fe-Mn family superoxide dismutase [Syntrophales bacterium]MDD5642987.1 Fe-Mn family superoxide dismutase [Syntrophales bacterium]